MDTTHLNLQTAIDSKNPDKIQIAVQKLQGKFETWALADLARAGHTECVRALLPCVRQKKVNDAIRAGVQGGHIDVVRVLQARANNDGLNKAVADACFMLNKDPQNAAVYDTILDYLFPLCNPETTLSIMLASHKWVQHTQPLHDKIAHTQNTTLRTAVADSGIPTQRKM